MDNQNTNTEEYIKKLPQGVQDLISEGTWETKTIEIGKKYSLNENQIDNLANSVLFILIGIDKPDDFLKTLTVELDISELLAEQIMEDLDKRVFEYALNFTQTKSEPKEKKIVPQNNQIPEIRPQNLPAQVGQTVKPSSTVNFGINTPIKGNSVLDQQLDKQKISLPAQVGIPRYIPSEKPETPVSFEEKKVEQVQRPAYVPRFTSSPETSKPTTDSQNQSRQNIADTKLNNVTSGASNPSSPKTPGPVKEYGSDPYREPIN